MKQLLILFFVFCIVGCSNKNPYAAALELKPLPSFSLLLPDSTTWVNTENIRPDKPVVMFFFSPHCPYCHAQMNDIMDNIGKLKNIQFYLVTSFSVPDMKQFYNEYKLADYPNIIVGRDSANFSGKYFKTPGVPFTAVFGKDKIPNKFFLGKAASSQIKKATEY